MLRRVGGAIKAADPTAEIVTAGLPDSRLRGAVRLAPFLRGLYKGGGHERVRHSHHQHLAVNARYIRSL